MISLQYLSKDLVFYVRREFNSEYNNIIISLYQNASVILQKCNARMILNRSNSLDEPSTFIV